MFIMDKTQKLTNNANIWKVRKKFLVPLSWFIKYLSILFDKKVGDNFIANLVHILVIAFER